MFTFLLIRTLGRALYLHLLAKYRTIMSNKTNSSLHIHFQMPRTLGFADTFTVTSTK